MPHATDGAEQRVVLHVARADLDAVGVLRHEMRPGFVHRLGDDGEPGLARARASNSRPRSPRPWNEYGEVRGLNAPPRSAVAPAARTARAAVTICSSLSTEQGPAMITTSSPADRHAGRDGDEGVFGPPLPRDLLVRLRDVDDLRDAGQGLDARRIDPAIVADEADRRALRPGHRTRLVAHLLDGADDPVDLLLGGAVPHDDEHYDLLQRGLSRAVPFAWGRRVSDRAAAGR